MNATDFLAWERAVECLTRRAQTMTPSDEGRALADRAIEYERLIAASPAESLVDVMVKVRQLGRLHAPPDQPPPADPYTQPCIMTILASLDRLRDEPTSLAELRAGQVELAHSLANMRQSVNILADGVRELLRDDRPAGA